MFDILGARGPRDGAAPRASQGGGCHTGPGRNAAIKRFDPHPPGQPADLFDSVRGRLPVVLELLGTPWIRRASELSAGDGTGRRIEIPIEVAWDPVRAAPVSFVRAGRTHRVDAVVQLWSTERFWWDPSRAVSRRCFRVLARGCTYDMAYDRLSGSWLLTGVAD